MSCKRLDKKRKAEKVDRQVDRNKENSISENQTNKNEDSTRNTNWQSTREEQNQFENERKLSQSINLSNISELYQRSGNLSQKKRLSLDALDKHNRQFKGNSSVYFPSNHSKELKSLHRDLRKRRDSTNLKRKIEIHRRFSKLMTNNDEKNENLHDRNINLRKEVKFVDQELSLFEIEKLILTNTISSANLKQILTGLRNAIFRFRNCSRIKRETTENFQTNELTPKENENSSSKLKCTAFNLLKRVLLSPFMTKIAFCTVFKSSDLMNFVALIKTKSVTDRYEIGKVVQILLVKDIDNCEDNQKAHFRHSQNGHQEITAQNIKQYNEIDGFNEINRGRRASKISDSFSDNFAHGISNKNVAFPCDLYDIKQTLLFSLQNELVFYLETGRDHRHIDVLIDLMAFVIGRGVLVPESEDFPMSRKNSSINEKSTSANQLEPLMNRINRGHPSIGQSPLFTSHSTDNLSLDVFVDNFICNILTDSNAFLYTDSVSLLYKNVCYISDKFTSRIFDYFYNIFIQSNTPTKSLIIDIFLKILNDTYKNIDKYTAHFILYLNHTFIEQNHVLLGILKSIPKFTNLGHTIRKNISSILPHIFTPLYVLSKRYYVKDDTIYTLIQYFMEMDHMLFNHCLFQHNKRVYNQYSDKRLSIDGKRRSSVCTDTDSELYTDQREGNRLNELIENKRKSVFDVEIEEHKRIRRNSSSYL